MYETKEKFGSAFSWVIKKKNIVQKDFAEECGMSPSSVTDYKTGRRRGDEDTREKIANLLGYEYRDFLDLGRWILDKRDPEKWVPPIHADGKFSEPLHQVSGSGEVGSPPQGEEVAIAPPEGMSVSEWLISLSENQKYGVARHALQAIGVPSIQVANALSKLVELPTELRISLSDDPEQRFDRIWEYVCKEEGKAASNWKDTYRGQFLGGKINDVELYVAAQDWLNNFHEKKAK